MSEFERSVRGIQGLTAFTAETLPVWLSRRMNEMFVGANEPLSDAELVDAFLRDEWLDQWGEATIDGQDVFVFEYCDEDLFELYEPARIAEMLHCGLAMVEPTWDFQAGTIACFTEHRRLLPRRNASTAALAAI